MLQKWAVRQFWPPLALALRHIRYPLGEYVPVPVEQLKKRAKKQIKSKPWHFPSVLLANLLDKGLRRAGHDLKFSHGSVPIRIVRTILVRLGLKPGERPTVAAHIRRWWKDRGGLPTD